MNRWNKQADYLKRKEKTKGPPKPTFLIVCEGSRTEPLYFEAFKVSSADILVEGTGKNTDSLVEHCIDLIDKNGPYDQVWCVFDRDSFPRQNFNRAFQIAESRNIKIAFTNEAFELWYLLHFHYYNTGMSRTLYQEKLTENLGRPYQKNDRTIYDTLLSKQDTAIQNAKRLLETYTPSNPEIDNPSTKVHLLVEELNKYI